MKTRSVVSAIVFFVVVAATALTAQESVSVSADLALTPPMGWNSWNKFACNVSEDLIKSVADAIEQNYRLVHTFNCTDANS